MKIQIEIADDEIEKALIRAFGSARSDRVELEITHTAANGQASKEFRRSQSDQAKLNWEKRRAKFGPSGRRAAESALKAPHPGIPAMAPAPIPAKTHAARIAQLWRQVDSKVIQAEDLLKDNPLRKILLDQAEDLRKSIAALEAAKAAGKK